MNVYYKRDLNETIIVPIIENETESSSKSHYEVLLPVIFIVIFILMLFLVYAYKNLDLKEKLLRWFCFCVYKPNSDRFITLKSFKHEPSFDHQKAATITTNPLNHYQLNRQLPTSAANVYIQHADFRRFQSTTMSNRQQNLYAENQYYFKQPNYIRPNFNHLGNDYDKIYSTHPSRMLLAFKSNQPYNSEDTIEYQLPNGSRDLENNNNNIEVNVIRPMAFYRPEHNGRYDEEQPMPRNWSKLFNKQEPLNSSEFLSLGGELTSTTAMHKKQLAGTAKLPQQQQVRQHNSTFRTQNSVHTPIASVNDSDLANMSRENKFSRLSNKLKDLSNESSLLKSICKELRLVTGSDKADFVYSNFSPLHKKSKYSRLCKSFTFLSSSQRRHDSSLVTLVHKSSRCNKHSNESSKMGTSQQPPGNKKIFSSEPTKLSSISFMPVVSSFKPSLKNSYLKNVKMIKSVSFNDSVSESNSNLISNEYQPNELFVVKKLNATTAAMRRNSNFADAAVQTSMILSDININNNSSSTNNSQVTNSLMQTNTFGSILGNFGSASLKQPQQQQQQFYSRKKFSNASSYTTGGKIRLRAYSDGNGLSDTSRSSNLGTHSASSSKLVYLKLQV